MKLRNITSYLIFILLFINSNIDANNKTYKSNIKKINHKIKRALKEKYKKYDKLSSSLVDIIDECEKNNIAGAVQLATNKGFNVKNNKITVIVEAKNKSHVPLLRNVIKLKKGAVISVYNNLIKIKINIINLKDLNEIIDIKKVRAPYKPVLHTVDGEQVYLTGANIVLSNGYGSGEGIKVAVIDGGFANLSVATQNGELPNNVIGIDYSGTGLTIGSVHGTGVAEVIYEMATNVQLYLLKIADSVDLGNAKDYCKNNGIHIINHSMGWVNSEWGRGDGFICAIANDANNNGILWVNSAGNAANKHYQAFFNNDGTGDHDYSGGDTINSIGTVIGGSSIYVFLCWDDIWGASGNDYDLYLYRWTGASWINAASSSGVQNGNDYPTEAITISAPQTAEYGILISKSSGSDKELQLFSFYQDFNYKTAARSLMAPACASGVFTVGAIAYNNWTNGPVENFSSRGPTQDLRVKPDICGVDGNLNSIYGRFYGTSSSSPCVAGASALVWSVYNDFNNEKVKTYLENSAIDMGSDGKDNEYGYGRVDLKININEESSTPCGEDSDYEIIRSPDQPAGIYNNLINFADESKNKMRFVFRDAGIYEIKIFNISGEVVMEWNSTYYSAGRVFEWDGKINGQVPGSNIYFVKIKSDAFKKVFKILMVK